MNPAFRRIALAAAVSGLVHAGAITVGRLERPEAPADLPPLAVRVVPVEAAAAPEIARPRAIKRSAARAAVATRALPVFPEPSAFAVPLESEPLETASAEDAVTPELPATSGEAEPAVVASAPATADAEALQPLPPFPRKGRITYTLVYGRDQFPVGRTVQTWQMDGARYQLASRSETTGIVDVIRSQHRTYLSRGTLTRKGLQPDTFLMSRDRGRGTEEARAKFDWTAGSVTLGPMNGQWAQPLPQHSQDLVSFMYQLSLDPPRPGRMRLPVTNGSRLEIYVLEVLPEEPIDTPLGVLRALPVKQVRTAGAESIDLWLATEYRHLPVRIRFYGKDGEPAGEQIVSEIRLSED